MSSTFGRLKQALRAPVKYLKRQTEPSPSNYSNLINTTEEAFDEVSQEWQALLVNNPHDVQTYNQLEQVAQGNFGTVDNPHLVFTSDAPFRYVGCTGPTNEDDYEGHEYLVFMLRDGPLQRCPSCGQVFKLVRLRDTFSPEQDYYQNQFLPYDYQDMIEGDSTVNINFFKMTTHHEYSQFETNSNMVYSMVNPDEHDRILTDPAYRMERTMNMQHKVKHYVQTLNDIEKEYIAQHGGLPRIPMNKLDYVTMVEVEKAILKMDRLFNRVDKFNARKFVDPDNHERREKRMLERSSERWDSNYTFFVGGLTEEEIRYQDYFETDLEKNPEFEPLQEKIDEYKVLSQDFYKLDRFDFQEGYTLNPEDDASGLIQKKLFRFKHRLAADSFENYARRNDRMVQRHLERFEKSGIKQVLEDLSQAVEKSEDESALTKKWAEFQMDEAVNQYKDYFESDQEEDLYLLEKAKSFDRQSLLSMYENVVQTPGENQGALTIPKYKRDVSAGFWTNFVNEYNHFKKVVSPTANQLIRSSVAKDMLPKDIHQIRAQELIQDEQIKLDKK